MNDIMRDTYQLRYITMCTKAVQNGDSICTHLSRKMDLIMNIYLNNYKFMSWF